MMSAEQIYQAIQLLPASERSTLLERLTRDLPPRTPVPEPPPAEGQGLDLIGFLADDPGLADEIYKIATVERQGKDMREWADEPRPAR